MTKKRPNTPQKKNQSHLFGLDPIRLNLLKWGVVAGAIGGFLLLQEQIIWQIVGISIMGFVANYHIAKAPHSIPRWQAAVVCISGVIVAIVGVVIISALMLAAYGSPGG